MYKKTILLMLLLSLTISAMADNSITGLWKTIDDESGEMKSIVKVYEYENKIYGRILITFLEGKLKDTYLDPKTRATEVSGEPFFCGLDIIWDLKESGKKYKKGNILDPQSGKIYSAEMWLDNNDLIVRGKIGPFGKNQTWLKATTNDLPPNVPEPQNLIPVIPSN